MKRTLILTAALLLICAASFAQKGNIGFVYPAGAQKGTTVEVTVGGQGISKAQGIIFSGSGVTGELIPLPEGVKPKKKKTKNIGEEDNLQLADQVRFRVTIDKSAALGMRDVRLQLPNGVTNRLYFEVGELPDVLEDGKAEVSAVSRSLPVTFNGQVTRSDVDRFRFHASKGQQLVLQVKGRVFVPYIADAVPGWFQPVIRLYGPDGKEVAYNDDYTFHVDPVLFFKVPASGDYDVEINDGLYRGREDFVYRIDVGELPFITSISPLGGRCGKKQTVTLSGFNLGSSTLKIKPSQEGFIPVSTKGRGGLTSNTVLFHSDGRKQADISGTQPNTSAGAELNLPLNQTVEGVFNSPMESRWYSFELGRKTQVHMEVIARRLGAPTDARLTLYDSRMKVVKDVDDFEDESDYMATHFADPQLTTSLKKGKYHVRIVESQARFGSEYGFRLTIAEAEPDFDLYLEPATFTVPSGGTGVFNVIITGKQNFKGDVKIAVDRLPKGFTYSAGPLKTAAKRCLVSVTAPSGAEERVVNPVVEGTSGGAVSITRTAKPVEEMMQAFYYEHLMPIEEFRMEVGKENPFTVEPVLPEDGLRIVPGQITPLKVRIHRKPGFDQPVTIMLKSPAAVKARAEAVVIPSGSSETVLEITSKNKSKKDSRTGLSVYGVLKASSKKVGGKGRAGFTASATSYSPVFEAVVAAPSPAQASAR